MPNKHNGTKFPGDTHHKGQERLTKPQKKEKKNKTEIMGEKVGKT